MLFTITTTHQPATDLGYLLHKNPAHVHSFSLSFGRAHIFYPEARPDKCTAALLLDIDPVELVRGRKDLAGGPLLEEYVSDRPYVASSFLSVAISRVLGPALAGRSKERPELAGTAIPLQAKLVVLPSRGGETLLRRLFTPLGYTVGARGFPLDERFPEWGQSRYFAVTLEATCSLSTLLTHIYVLIPVLDDEKHYWVGEEEVEKLLRHGGDWLGTHPERELIVDRYLKHQRSLTRLALARLLEEDQPDPDAEELSHAREEETVEASVGLWEQRQGAVMAVLKAERAKRVLDLGCGEGRLLQRLVKDRDFEEVVGMDVSPRALETAANRLKLDRLPSRQQQRIRLIQGSLIYRDERLSGYDAAAVVEVIEHMDPPRLAAFERVVFEHARPRVVVTTTPNAEYNVRFENLPRGAFRHRDHRFEWTRDEFEAWAREVARRFGYAVRFLPVGPEDPQVGAPTQMGVFVRD
jgi:3' terminal RNA ribose 2'-O-methyltransferase Hen1